MEQHGDAGYASFAAAHETRLACSLVAETGLPRERAAAVAAEVLPAAFERSFASDGAAYGWLRVAARHLAAGSPTWADAADTALGRAEFAAAAFAGLPSRDRELLRLRYVEGLLPDAVAARLGLTVADVVAGIERARALAARSLPRRTHAVSVPRAVAAAALGVAAAAFLVAGPPHAVLPPAAARTLPSFADIEVPVASSREPVPAADRTRALATRGTAVPGDVTPRPPVDADPPDTPCDTCGGRNLVDTLAVAVPDPVQPVLGEDELEVEQAAGREHVKFCDTIPANSPGVRCIRTEH
jgi:DNA-directed RNA polymerase specialized sigma24 family protein